VVKPHGVAVGPRVFVLVRQSLATATHEGVHMSIHLVL
jgi:hypothetical protein